MCIVTNLKNMLEKLKIDEYVVVPAHGVGKLLSRETVTMGGKEKVCLEILFEKINMKIFVPIEKLEKQGVRPPVMESELENVWNVLKTDSRGMRVVWSKRSREYNKKLLTGNICDVAEVVRDLFPNAENPNRSYSERIIFEDGIQRLSSEIGIALNVNADVAEAKILDILSKYHETYSDGGDDVGEIIEDEDEPIAYNM